MIIRDYRIENKYIKIQANCLPFTSHGVYVLAGPNGTGKSTFLKDVVFNDAKIEFESKEQETLYHTARTALFSYVPQEIPSPEVSGKEYIKKASMENDEQLNSLMGNFNLDSAVLRENVCTLSGGERTKLYIVGALLKDTPYVFMDEPTNNLDDESVEKLVTILKKLGERKIIVIVSHDSRIQDAADYSLGIADGKIEFNGSSVPTSEHPWEEEETGCSSRVPTKVGFATGVRIQRNTTNLLYRLIIVCILGGLVFFNYFVYDANYARESNLSSDSILVYLVDGVYADLNEDYASAEHLNIDENRYYSMIKYGDFNKLLKSNGNITGAYIQDEEKMDRFLERIERKGNANNPVEVSVPEVVSQNYLSQIGLEDAFRLKYGSVPKDDAKEVVISEQRANKEWPGIEASEAIGKTFRIKDKTYTVSGISTKNILWTSLDSTTSLFYTFESDTYSEFVKDSLKYKNQNDYVYKDEVDDIILLTKEGKEQTVLNSVMQEYPADNYYSQSFDNAWVKGHNRFFVGILALANVGISLVTLILLMFLMKLVIKSDFEAVKDYSYYYITKENVKKAYQWSSILITGIVVILTLMIGAAASGDLIVSKILLTVIDALIMMGGVGIRIGSSMRRLRIC